MDADKFNELYAVGTIVRYYPVEGDPHCIVTNTRTPAWTLGSGQAVVSVVGIAGGVSLDHVIWMGVPISVNEIYQLDSEHQLLTLDGKSIKIIRKLGNDQEVVALHPKAARRLFDALTVLFARSDTVEDGDAGSPQR